MKSFGLATGLVLAGLIVAACDETEKASEKPPSDVESPALPERAPAVPGEERPTPVEGPIPSEQTKPAEENAPAEAGPSAEMPAVEQPAPATEETPAPSPVETPNPNWPQPVYPDGPPPGAE
jgi:hypothetical protein